jgi:hypothetical protein
MVRIVKYGLRFATVATLACVALMSAEGRTVSREGDTPSRPTFDANALVATLPSVLTPPAVGSGSRLVSMIADDIDADGDLDVVANDGSLNLIVWINDGTGHLTRQETRQTSNLWSEAPGPGFANEPAGSETFIHSLSSFLQPDSAIVSLPSEPSRPRWGVSTAALQPDPVSGRIPRAPPVPVVLS